MKLKVLFYKQTTPLNCGPVALKMVLDYFGGDENIKDLEKKTGIKEGKAITSIQIAVAAASSGYKTDFYSKSLLFDEKNMKHGFYEKYSDMDLEKSKKWFEKAKEVGVNMQEKTLPLKEILGFVTKDSIPIILLDWNTLKSREEKGYQGHFVPIVGFDEENVYIHNHGFSETQSFMPIPKTIFDKARKAEGTDEDVVVIYRK